MLDTHCRKYIQPLIAVGADIALKLGLTANGVTIIAMLVGLLSGVLTAFNLSIIGVAILWFSGYLDAVDGTMARKTKSSSAFGTVMDITFDRMVEGAIILGVAYKYPQFSFISLILAISIIISMTIFLTTGPLAENKGEKTFHYQAGLAERTEGFLMLSLMMLLGDKAGAVINIFTVMVLFTAGQRFFDAKKILK
ncbi:MULTISPECIES: CDP-alcohol phosphatidyltransferase family protein [Cetobacterium]|jgi:phosphatidylglycerophosphate synthase|uniref:CDP-alcohol phosphatidyltransferase family protein n=1 Tax=Candidatus Cetobacterium colombiensis TaxID=3073100 RepID=A0ABU4W760_9FUSO|nr:CDP-alcohol phosphatidyltransferase family protein [Candidatus Cetobacterium colombiensis]MDX8335368.1 CDP-alcohol phosphatidyltransferase family protein [Candidatus Cetobacterium colombiensis]